MVRDRPFVSRRQALAGMSVAGAGAILGDSAEANPAVQAGSDTLQVVSAGNRAALAEAVPGRSVLLAEWGREGVFLFDRSNLAREVAIDWAQGIYVAPSSAPTGASGAWVRKFDGWHNVKWWGAKGDGTYLGVGTDDSAAIQAALNFLDDRLAGDKRGGTLFFPMGHYICSAPLDLDRMHNITLCGPSSPGQGFTAPPSSQIIYTGTGATDFLQAYSTMGFTLRNMGVRYTSTLFTGNLISFKLTLFDTAYALIERCLLGGQDAYNAARIIDLNEAILSEFRHNHIFNGKVGIGGRHSTLVNYSNGHTIFKNIFDNLTTSAITNAGEGWNIWANDFEGIDNGVTGGMPRAYWDDLAAGSITSGLSWIGNWCGDATNVNDAWFCSNNTTLWGCEIRGGIWQTYGGDRCIKFTTQCAGIIITGSSMQTAPDFGGFPHLGLTMEGNVFYEADINGDDFVGLTAGAINVSIRGNYRNGGLVKTVIRHSDVDEFTTGNVTVTSVKVGANQVVGARGAALPADATDLASAITLLNAVKARLKTTGGHGLVAD